MAPTSEAPAWFRTAIGQGTNSHFAPARSGRIHYRSWNAHEDGKPGLLLAHGYRGHSHWWDGIAPFLTDHFRVYALDFAGMGDSEQRSHYDARGFADNLASVLDHAGLERATLVGHSYGGARVLRACVDFPHRIAHAIILDSYVNFADADSKMAGRRYGNPHPFPDLASALARYRLLPEQPGEAWARDHIALHSLKQVAGGWNWKFDQELPFAMFETDGAALLAQITVPIDIVCGEHSVVLPPLRARRAVAALTSSVRARGPIVMPNAHHHLMIDQPLALIAVLRSLLA